jgi:hypothetical protein
MPPDEMERTLRPASGDAALRRADRALQGLLDVRLLPDRRQHRPGIESGDVFDAADVRRWSWAPGAGAYCVFGNLFVRNASDPEPIRIDRHPR